MSDNERGSGLVSSLFGVVMVLVTILGVAHVAVNIWTRSMVSAAAHDAARRLAAADNRSSTELRQAEERVRAQMGKLGRSAHTSVDAAYTGEFAQIRVETRSPTFLPGSFFDRPRTITTRAEAYRGS